MSEPTNHNTGSQGNQGQQGNVAGANYGVQNTYYNSGGRQLSKQEYRNRQNILTQMRTEVESRLTQSIHRAAFVNLGKEQQPQQVQRPWDMSVKVGEQRSVQLPPQTTILDVFDNPTISGKFLILGKPGGGKTTTLLELAEALIERAEGDSDAPIPVILELSTWQEVTKREFPKVWKQKKYDPSMKEWVLSQLVSKGVSQEMGEQWLREKELVLLLDGLDELQPERQAKCVRAINQFLSSEFSPSHLVVCSRKEEYENYEEILLLNEAICLEDLTNEQIRNYFASVNLGEFWESIKGSEKIVNFIRQPLFLAVTSLAYQQIDVEEWRNCNTEERAIDYLISTYIVNQIYLNKDSKTHKKYRHQGLIILAKYFGNEDILIEEIDPGSFLSLLKKEYYWNVCILAFWMPFMTFVLYMIAGFLVEFLSEWTWSWGFIIFFDVILIMFVTGIAGFSITILLYYVYWAVFFPVVHSRVFWSNGLFDDEQEGVLLCLCKIIVIALLFLACISYVLTGFISIDPVFVAIFYCFLSFKKTIQTFLADNTFISNNRVRSELFNIFYFLVYSATCVFLGYVVLLATHKNSMLLFFPSTSTTSAVFGLYFTIVWGGGSAVIKYLLFRIIIWANRIMPWNITRFLDYCTERLILQRVGNRYRFIHRLVQEHFAKLEIQKE